MQIELTTPSDAHELTRESIIRLFAKLRPDIKRLVQTHLDRRISRRVDASDVVQAAFLDAEARLDRFLQERPMSVRQWLLYLSKMKTLETNHHHLRTQKRATTREQCDGSRVSELRSSSDTPSQCVSQKEVFAHLGRAIEQLPARYRRVIELRHFEGATNKDVSAVLGVSQKAASKVYLRALRHLQTVMQTL